MNLLFLGVTVAQKTVNFLDMVRIHKEQNLKMEG